MTMSKDYNVRQQERMSGGKKTLIGCGIGCATIIGLVLIAVGFGGWWLFSPEDQVPTERILNSASSAAFRLEDISNNQEVIQLLTDISREARKNKRYDSTGAPPFFGDFNKYFKGDQDPEKFIRFVAPKEATLSVSTDEAGNTAFVIAANFRKGTRIPKLFLNSVFKNNDELKSKKISTGHGELFLFDNKSDWNSDRSEQLVIGYYEGTFVIGNDPEYAVSALDSLYEKDNTGELNESLSEPYHELSREGSLAYGVMDSSQLMALADGIDLFNDEPGPGMKQAAVTLSRLSGKEGIINLRIDCSSAEFAAKANEEIERLKTGWIEKAENKGFDMEVMNSSRGEQINIQFKLNDLKDSLIDMMRNAD